VTKPVFLDEQQFGAHLAGIAHTAFRLELQPAYSEPCEEALLAAFTRGERPDPREAVPELRDWYGLVTWMAAGGKRIERVRVQDDPPTPYQEFERWLDQWNIPAGEVMRYMTRDTACITGLLPAAGDADWWLLDSSRLIVMRFDGQHHRISNELITRPETVVQACAWRDLAIHHSVQRQLSDAAA
jgi:hypothetical protein